MQFVFQPMYNQPKPWHYITVEIYSAEDGRSREQKVAKMQYKTNYRPKPRPLK